MASDKFILEIRNWFKDHVATLTQGELEILDWQKPDTAIFKVRYVFDGPHMYVSGDLGEAVFRFTEQAHLFRVSRYDLSYFEEKLRAFCDARRDFDRDKAKQYLTEQKNEEVINERVYEELVAIADQCSSTREWGQLIYSYDLPDAWEWLPGAGDIIPIRIVSYLEGLKMANEQLTKIQEDLVALRG